MVRVVTPGLHKGAPYAPLTEVAGQHRWTQPLRPHHDAAQGRRLQAALPRDRLQARQGRHRLPNRAHRVRSEPHGAHRAAALRRRRAPLHHRAEGLEDRRSADGGPRCADQDRQLAAAAQHPDRLDGALHRDEAGQGRADGAFGRRLGAARRARQGYATLRLRSGEMRKVPAECRATIGEVGNSEHNLEKLGKAGASRWRGVRPTVRGAAMNPVDHPHGGGEGRAGQGNPHPVSPWGQPSKGYKTRKNKRTTQFIVRDRRG